MADKLVTLQDENKTPIYPESRASVVKTSDGTTVEDALARKQPSGNYATKEELSNYATTESLTQGLKGKADTTAIPTKLSELTNDSNYLTDAPSDGKQYARKDGAWSEVSGGSTQYLDLSMFTGETGTLSDEDYQKVVKAYEDGVSKVYVGETLVQTFPNIMPLSIAKLDNGYILSINIDVNYKDEGLLIYGFSIEINDTDKSFNTYQISRLNYPLTLYLNGSGTKALTDNGEYAEFAKPTKVESGGSGSVTKQINPNTFYKFGEVTNLTISFAAEESYILNEYMFEFVSGSTPTTLSVPDTVKWSGGSAPTIEANKTYQVSIVNNLAVFATF